MLTEIVTRALSQLTGRPMSGELIKGQFQYAYASDDGQFVAILTHDMTTYVVDLSARRYFAECGGSPRDSPAMCWKWRDRPRAGIPGPPPTTCSTWTWTRTNWPGAIVRACALARREDQWRAAPPDRVARSGSICLNRRLAPVFAPRWRRDAWAIATISA